MVPAEFPGRQRARDDTRFLLQTFRRLAGEGATDDTIAGCFPCLARRLHHRCLARAGAADHGGDPLTTGNVFDGGLLFVGQPFVTRKRYLEHRLPDAMRRPLRQPDCPVGQLGFEPDQLACRVFRRCANSRREVQTLAIESEGFGVLQDARHQALEEAGIIDIAMQDLGDVAFVEHALLPRNQVEHEFRIALDPAGILCPPRLLQIRPFERSFLLRRSIPTGCFPLDRLRANAEMNRRRQLDALLFEGPPIDPDIEARKR